MTTLLNDSDREAVAPLRALGTVKRRYGFSGIEIRSKGEGSTLVDFYGHASVTDIGYDMYGGPDGNGGWTEYVDGGAFKRTLAMKPDVAFLLNHEGMTLARTKSGTLKLAEDDVGLETKAELDTRVSVVNDIVVGMEAKNLDEMSFAFRVIKDVWLTKDGEEVPWWNLDGIERHIQEVSLQNGDVSIVNYGANPYTSAELRAMDALHALAEARGAGEPPEIDLARTQAAKYAFLLAHS
jgi:HK97 family phage prohead protease